MTQRIAILLQRGRGISITRWAACYVWFRQIHVHRKAIFWSLASQGAAHVVTTIFGGHSNHLHSQKPIHTGRTVSWTDARCVVHGGESYVIAILSP